jgi:signal transduction histidine kinase
MAERAQSDLEEIDRIAHLVEGLLLLARADAGVLRMDLRPVQLKDLVEEIYEQAKVLADSHSVNLRLGSVEPVSIQGDYQHLRRLLLNLVDNGIKYRGAGGSVTLSLQSQEEWASLRVSDTGVGLTEDEQKQILSRFYRATEVRSQGGGGAGLGLSIARSIAEAHGVRIDVESDPDQGNSFTVLLKMNIGCALACSK